MGLKIFITAEEGWKNAIPEGNQIKPRYDAAKKSDCLAFDLDGDEREGSKIIDSVMYSKKRENIFKKALINMDWGRIKEGHGSNWDWLTRWIYFFFWKKKLKCLSCWNWEKFQDRREVFTQWVVGNCFFLFNWTS